MFYFLTHTRIPNMEYEIVLMLAVLYFSKVCNGISVNVSLRVPRYVMVDGSATLYCDYNVKDEEIHKVEWLRGDQKLFQYVKGRTPPYRNFTIQGAVIDWNESDQRKVSLKNLEFDASGSYTCEVTTDTPIYTKPSEEEYITVMESQTVDPHITFNQANFTVGDILDVNCTSGLATPVPELTWLLNGALANDTFIRSFPEHRQSSSTVQLTMRVTAEHYPELRLTCLSTIPSYMGHQASFEEYADFRSHTITVQVSQQPTEAAQVINSARSLSKIPSNLPTEYCLLVTIALAAFFNFLL